MIITPLETKGALTIQCHKKLNIHPMKTTAPLILLLFLPAFLNAAIWRVDNDPGRIADFTNLQAAVDDAQVMAGDIVYVAGSAINYGTVTISKSLFVFGPGFFLTQNSGESAAGSPATFTSIIIGAGGSEDAAGTLLSGITVKDIFVFDSNVTLKRNRVTRKIDLGTGSINVTQTLIIQNYISGSVQFGNQGAINSINGANSDMVIKNNFIRNFGGGGTQSIKMISGNTGTIEYNIIEDGETELFNATFRFNIITTTDLVEINNTLPQYNISTTTQGALSNSTNQTSVPLADIFVDSFDSSDGSLVLKDLSPALAIGPSGEDAGMFAGPEPYVLSGIPALPTITEINAPTFASPTSGITITVKAKARN